LTDMRYLFIAALALPMVWGSDAKAYDNDEQALRLRDTLADPSVPLAWDRRHHPETWRYRASLRHDYCGRRAYWNGEECVRVRRRYY
jgi:hypothetical protein